MITETENEIQRPVFSPLTKATNAETDEIEFKSLKGIAGRWLDIDEIRRERLKL